MMLERIAAFIDRELETRRIPGAALAVVRPNEPVWARGFGVASIETGEPMTAQTPFSIQSITKTFVATAIMQLQEKGLVSVDDPVAKHLPGVVQNQWETENPVLVRQLLTHTSGLPVDTAGGPPGGPRKLDEFVRLVAKTVRRPGTETVYANWGYATAGILVEALTGEAWYDYIAHHICEPLGMRATSVHPPENTAYGHYLSAVDCELHRLGSAQWPVEPSDPAGGLVSTVGDLGLFASAHLAGGAPLLSRETAAQMHAVSTAESRGGGMSLGFRGTRSNGRRLLCHGGDGSGFTNFLGLYPDEGIAVALTLTRAGVQAARAVIANTILAMASGLETPRRGVPTGATPRDGLYTSSFWDIQLAIETNNEGITARPLSGLVISDGPEPSLLVSTGNATFTGNGGMLNGFEITIGEDGDLYGGLYPYRFTRSGDIPLVVSEPLDETADLTGAWSGTITTPMGALALTLEVSGPTAATVSTPFGQDRSLKDCAAGAGRVSGYFTLTVPTVGEMTMYPRLEARGGKLKGPIYAQGWFGELAMPTELEEA